MLSYLALGDSYTIGEMVPDAENFPHQLVSFLEKKGIQIAAPRIIATTGWTTDELATGIREAKIQDSFSLVTLLIGVNNQYRGRSVENYQEEFTKLLNQAIVFANGHARHVVVLSIPDWSVTPFAAGRDRGGIAREIDVFNGEAKEITLAHICAWLDITDSTRKNGQDPQYLAEDGLHPSGKEYAIWVERLAPIVMNALH